MHPKHVDPDACEIRGIETRDEAELVADLYGKAFRGYEWHYRNYTDLLFKRVPREQWRLSRVVWTPDGVPVASVRIADRTMRLGSVMVRMGGIGDVCTHPFCRKLGLMRRLFTHCVEFMRDEPYDLSILGGIPNFYDKFGYITAHGNWTLQLPRGQVARLRGPHAGRRARRSDADAVERLFRGDLAIRDGAMLRPDRGWLGRGLKDRFARLLVDDKGQARAYYWGAPDGDAFALREVSLGRKPDRDGIVSVIADMVKVAKRCEKPNLRFDLPPEHPIGQFCVADGCTLRRNIGHRGGGMARITNLETLCSRMAPEWASLLAASPAAGWRGRLRLKTDMGTIDLAVSPGAVEPQPPEGRTTALIAADQGKLCRLVLGFHSPATALMLEEVRITQAALPLAEALFPPRGFVIFPADHF